jgi:hypothetical protein
MAARTHDSLEEALRSHLERYGGVVLRRMIDSLKSSYDSDAPELASENAFKDFLEGKDEFRISTSVNNVERVRLTNAHRPSPGLFGMVITTLEDLVRNCPPFRTSPSSIMSLNFFNAMFQHVCAT